MIQDSPRLDTAEFDRLPANLQVEVHRLQQGNRTIPSFLKILANAPIVLEAYIAFSNILERSTLSPVLRHKIAIAVSELNSSGYDIAALNHLASDYHLSPEEFDRCRSGTSEVRTHRIAIEFATTLIRKNGNLNDAELERFRHHQNNDGFLTEIIATVACTHFANLINNLAQTPYDHPPVSQVRRKRSQ